VLSRGSVANILRIPLRFGDSGIVATGIRGSELGRRVAAV